VVSSTRDANGNFIIELVTPLAPRQLIYISRRRGFVSRLCAVR
jgi:hypothetical protein